MKKWLARVSKILYLSGEAIPTTEQGHSTSNQGNRLRRRGCNNVVGGDLAYTEISMHISMKSISKTVANTYLTKMHALQFASTISGLNFSILVAFDC